VGILTKTSAQQELMIKVTHHKQIYFWITVACNMVTDPQFLPTTLLVDTNSCPALWQAWRESSLKYIRR